MGKVFLNVIENGIIHTSCYSSSVVTMAISCVVSEIAVLVENRDFSYLVVLNIQL